MLTKGQAESKSKSVLVNKVLELQTAVENASSTPLTEAQIVKRQLTLAEKAVEAEEKVKQLDVDFELAKERLRKEHELATSRTLEEVTDEYKSLKNEIVDAEAALKTSITVTEAEAKETIAAYEEKVEAAKTAADEAEALRKERTQEAEAAYREKLNQFAVKHTRDMEEKEYEHSKALRQSDEDYAEKLATSLGMVLVPTAELERLKAIEPTSAEELASTVKAEVGKATGILKANHERALKDKEHEAALIQVELKGQVSSLNTQLEAVKQREATLEAQVKEIPAVIEKAVKAANAEISVTNEAGKK